MFEKLPFDIFFIILYLQDFQSICKFRGVSKYWNNFIINLKENQVSIINEKYKSFKDIINEGYLIHCIKHRKNLKSEIIKIESKNNLLEIGYFHIENLIWIRSKDEFKIGKVQLNDKNEKIWIETKSFDLSIYDMIFYKSNIHYPSYSNNRTILVDELTGKYVITNRWAPSYYCGKYLFFEFDNEKKQLLWMPRSDLKNQVQSDKVARFIFPMKNSIDSSLTKIWIYQKDDGNISIMISSMIYYFDKYGLKYTKNIDYFYDYHLHLLPYNTKSFFIDKCFGCFMQIIFTKSGLWIQTLEKKLLILEINLGDVVINKFGMPENFYKFNIYSSNVKEIKSVDTYIYLYCSNDNLWIYHYEETTNMFSGDSQSYGYYKLSIQDFERGHKASVVHKSKSSITPSLENPLAIFKNKKTSKQEWFYENFSKDLDKISISEKPFLPVINHEKDSYHTGVTPNGLFIIDKSKNMLNCLNTLQ
jgi:hypothetical protein